MHAAPPISFSPGVELAAPATLVGVDRFRRTKRQS
jgi:hypothetical protein